MDIDPQAAAHSSSEYVTKESMLRGHIHFLRVWQMINCQLTETLER